MNNQIGIKRAGPVQEMLFELPLREFDFPNIASARTYYGAAVEEIACGLLNLTPIDTDARFKTCYDAQKGNTFFEIKSVKRTGGGCIIFKKRLDNDVAAGVPLFYVFVSHNVTGAKSNRELWGRLAETVKVVRVVPFALVLEACSKLKVKKHYTDPNHGSMKYGYEKGYYTLPLKYFDRCDSKDVETKTELFGFKFVSLVRKLF